MIDVAIIGGGLSGGLLAWRLSEMRPELTVRLVERGATLGGNHSWSFHDSDLDAASAESIAPMIVARGTSHEVRFPAFRRVLAGGYATITSESFDREIRARLGRSVRLNAVADIVSPTRFVVDGETMDARVVIDARGDRAADRCVAYQKFLGLEIECVAPHGVERPVLMDATVPQLDGYRFVYTLPLDERRLLVEDTYYSDTPALDPSALRERVETYVQAQGWQIDRMLREEHGVLPIVLDQPEPERGSIATIGMRAGLFHATTGYSLPDTLRLIERLVRLPNFDAPNVSKTVFAYARQSHRRQRFYRLLNRLLFLAAKDATRYGVLQRFYRLPEPLIARFYAGESTFGDKLRILSGKPPVPVAAAIAALPPSAARGRR